MPKWGMDKQELPADIDDHLTDIAYLKKLSKKQLIYLCIKKFGTDHRASNTTYFGVREYCPGTKKKEIINDIIESAIKKQKRERLHG